MTMANPLQHVPIVRLADDRRGSLVTFEDFPDVYDKIRRIAELAYEPEQTRAAFHVAHGVAGGMRTFDALRALHNTRARLLRYELENEQTLQSPDHALARGVGDCTAHAVLGAAMLGALGYSSALVAMGGTESDPAHLSLLVALHGPQARAAPPRWLPWEDRCAIVPGWTWTDTSTPIGQSAPVRFAQPPACPEIPLQLGVSPA